MSIIHDCNPPDLYYSLFCQIIAIFGFAANCWMNAVISHQLFKMLRVSHSSGRYVAPTIMHVGKQTLAVYTYAAILASAW